MYGKVYIVASHMKTPGDVTHVLLHESLGHYGLRGLFGQELQGYAEAGRAGPGIRGRGIV